MGTNFKYGFLILLFLFGCSGDTAKTTTNQPGQSKNMSSTILKLIPTDPSYVPDKANQDKARAFLIKFYKTGQIEISNTETIEFIDQGGNFESVSCNLCSHNIEIEHWQDAMDKAYEKQFTDLTFVTTCCNKKASLNELNYKSPAGFAKFAIKISDAQTEISEKGLKELQAILGKTLRIIWAHY